MCSMRSQLIIITGNRYTYYNQANYVLSFFREIDVVTTGNILLKKMKNRGLVTQRQKTRVYNPIHTQ